MKPRDRSLGSSRTVSLLVTLVIISLVLILVSQSPQLQPVQDALHTAVAPVQRTINDASTTVGGWIDTFRTMDSLRRENEQLQQEVESLTSEVAGLQDKQRDYDDLRRQLNFEREFPNLNGIGAIVLGRDPNGLSQILEIDRGQADSILVDQPVTDLGGFFIGKVRSVDGAHRAQVLLITDADSSLGVYIDRTGTNGVVKGGWPDHLLTVLHLDQNSNVAKGDLIKTAGSGLVPRGLILGQVLSVTTSDVAVEQQADAYPLADLGAVNQVLVILSGEGVPQPTATPTQVPTATVTPFPTLTATPTPRRTATPRR